MLHYLYTIPLFYTLFTFTASYLTGIYCYDMINKSNMLLLTCATIATVSLLSVLLRKQSYVALYVVAAFGFWTGYALFCYQIKTHARVAQLFYKKACTVTGTIESIETTFSGSKLSHQLTLEIIYLVETESCYKISVPAHTKIIVYIKQASNLRVGDTVVFHRLYFTANQSKDYGLYLVKEGVATTTFASYTRYSLLHRPTYSLSRWIQETRWWLLQQLQAYMSPTLYWLYALIFLGKRVACQQELLSIKQLFVQWGIAHYLARSGLHVSIFILIWIFAFRFIPIHFFIKQLCIVGITILYALCSWSSISFFRAFFSFLLYRFCLLNKYPTQMMHILTLVTWCTVLLNPAQGTFLDFQLSFALTAALLFFYTTISKK